MASHNRSITTRQVTMASSFAALYFVLRAIPIFQMVGVSGRFTAADFLLTSIALLNGFWGATLSVLIGTVLGYGVRPPVFLGLDFLPAVANVMIASLLLSMRFRIARATYVAAFLAFVLSPYSLLFGFNDVPYAWLHIVGLIVILSPIGTKIPVWVNSEGPRQIAGVGLLAFVGTMGQHLVGGLLYEMVAGLIGGINPSDFMNFWRVIFWLYPTERLIILAFSTILALAMHRSLKKWAAT